MTPPDHPAARPSRRAALRLGATAAAAGAATLSGCSLNNPLDEEKTPAAEAVRDLAPDVAVAVQAATMVRTARAAVAATAERHPALAPRMTELEAVHDAHLAAVAAAVPDGVDTSAAGQEPVVPGQRAQALRDVVRAQRTLHDGLVGLALTAQSGPFARLLGSMAAAVSQRLHGLAA